jgi:glutathione S-transferase
MLELHYAPGNASLVVHLLLQELGTPFALREVDRANQAHKSPAYLKLNPNGLIPVLTDGELVLYETAAIVLHLVDTHPQAGLAPATLGSTERAQFYKWLMWLGSTVQPLFSYYFYTERYLSPGNAEGTAQLKAAVNARIEACVDQVEAEFARHGGPWFLGQGFSALDPYLLVLCRWTRNAPRPARTLPHLAAYLQRMLARPSARAVFEKEGLATPWV